MPGWYGAFYDWNVASAPAVVKRFLLHEESALRQSVAKPSVIPGSLSFPFVVLSWVNIYVKMVTRDAEEAMKKLETESSLVVPQTVPQLPFGGTDIGDNSTKYANSGHLFRLSGFMTIDSAAFEKVVNVEANREDLAGHLGLSS